MTLSEGMHYIAVGNPISKAIIGTASSMFSRASHGSNTASVRASASAMKAVSSVMPPMWKLAGHHYYFMRFAGLSGAAAVVLGAIGSHYHGTQEKPEAKAIFETANRFHFFHTIALMGMPMAKYPYITGSLMVMGTVLFSGVLYYRAFTGEMRYSRYAPIGGTCLILAWLSLML